MATIIKLNLMLILGLFISSAGSELLAMRSGPRGWGFSPYNRAEKARQVAEQARQVAGKEASVESGKLESARKFEQERAEHNKRMADKKAEEQAVYAQDLKNNTAQMTKQLQRGR